MTEKLNEVTPLMAPKGLFANVLHSFIRFVQSIVATVRGFTFAFYYPIFVDLFYNCKVVPFRKDVFSDIETVVPSDKQEGKLRILEIGSGPGCNFHFFPKQCRYIALDKNAHFKNTLVKNLLEYPGIQLEDFINASGEDMNSVPSNSVDIVVTSCIFCSVDNCEEVLKEIKRVLVPGGRYYFFEHVLDEPDTNRYKWQVFFNKIGLWQFAGNGCRFVNFEEKISKAKFHICHGKRYVFQNNTLTYYIVYLVASHFGGYAEKGK